MVHSCSFSEVQLLLYTVSYLGECDRLVSSNLSPCLALGVLHDGAALAAVALGRALLLQLRVVHRREGKVASGGADDRGRRLLAARLPSRAKEKALGIGDKE